MLRKGLKSLIYLNNQSVLFLTQNYLIYFNDTALKRLCTEAQHFSFDSDDEYYMDWPTCHTYRCHEYHLNAIFFLTKYVILKCNLALLPQDKKYTSSSSVRERKSIVFNRFVSVSHDCSLCYLAINASVHSMRRANVQGIAAFQRNHFKSFTSHLKNLNSDKGVVFQNGNHCLQVYVARHLQCPVCTQMHPSMVGRS